MAEGEDFRARLRDVARALARGDKLAAAEAPPDSVVALDAVWPARREGDAWYAAPPWPEGFPRPALPLNDIAPATAFDVESMGRTPKPLFLVGFVYVNAGGVSLEQFIAAHPDEEPGVLAATAKALAAAPLLLSYNGFTFDLPIIRDRMNYWRLGYKPPPGRHVDLLWLVRKHYKRKLDMPWCGLAEAERYVLGVARPHDVASSQVPELYERAARASDARPLLPVLRHNLYDLAAMALLYLRMAREIPTAFDEAPGAPGEEAALF